MISIRKNMSDLDRCHQSRDLLLECYTTALRNTAHYAVELESEITEPYRQYLTALAAEVGSGDDGILKESRATLRGLLREYRDKAAQYLSGLRDELAGTARALQEIMESLNQSDGDHEARLRAALDRLRAASKSPEAGVLRAVMESAATTIEQSVVEIRKQHQVTVSQFLVEIRMLHKRIDSLESAAVIDSLTKLFHRAEMENRIRSLAPGPFSLLLVRASGLKIAAATFDDAVAAELTGAFTKRLRNSLPPNAVIGRWGPEEFIAVLHTSSQEAMNCGKFIAEHLGGSYACLKGGKTVRPSLQLRVGIVESNEDEADRVLERVNEFLTMPV
jgi:GGDEF domain-containing protein